MIQFPPRYFNHDANRGHVQPLQILTDTTSKRILSENNKRISALVSNISANTVYLGNENTDLLNDGFPLMSGLSAIFFSNTELYAASSAGGDLIGIMEEELT